MLLTELINSANKVKPVYNGTWIKTKHFFIGKYQSLEYAEETNVKLQYLSQMGLSPGSEKNNNN
jgi:hypothetical protein